MREPSQAARFETNQRRQDAEMLVRFAEHLAPADRALVQGVYQHGMSAADLARAIGTRPRTIRKRLARLLARVNAPTFRYVLMARQHWPNRQRRIAEAVFLRGETQRQVAARLNATIHEVRRAADRIQAVAEAPLSV